MVATLYGSFFIGILAGVVITIPPGPIAFALMKLSLDGKKSAGLRFALGATAIDTLYVLVSAYFSSKYLSGLRDLISKNAWAWPVFQLGCVCLLLLIGVMLLIKPMVPNPTVKPVSNLGDKSPYLFGALVALANLASPTLFPTLVLVIAFLHTQGWVGNTLSHNLSYTSGFSIGTIAWFIVVLQVSARMGQRLTPSSIRIASRVTGALFLLCALVIGLRLIL